LSVVKYQRRSAYNHIHDIQEQYSEMDIEIEHEHVIKALNVNYRTYTDRSMCIRPFSLYMVAISQCILAIYDDGVYRDHEGICRVIVIFL